MNKFSVNSEPRFGRVTMLCPKNDRVIQLEHPILPAYLLAGAKISAKFRKSEIFTWHQKNHAHACVRLNGMDRVIMVRNQTEKSDMQQN